MVGKSGAVPIHSIHVGSGSLTSREAARFQEFRFSSVHTWYIEHSPPDLRPPARPVELRNSNTEHVYAYTTFP